jgi:hypothetical protein
MLAWLLFEAGCSAEAAKATDAKCRQSGRAAPPQGRRRKRKAGDLSRFDAKEGFGAVRVEPYAALPPDQRIATWTNR